MSPILADNIFLRATATNFFFFLSMNGFILLPLHITSLGGTEVEVGVIMGLYNAIGIVCQPLVGPWVDALGRRPFMLLGVGLALVAALLAAAVPEIGVLALVRVLQGLAFSCFFVANYSYVIDLVPTAQRGWALGIYGVAGLREREREGSPPVRGFPWEPGGLAEAAQLSMAVTLFFGLGAGTIFVFLPTFAEHLGVQTLALFYTAYSLSAIAVRVFGGRLSDVHGRRAVIMPSMFAQAGATALLATVAFLVSRTSATPVVPVLFLTGLLAGGAHGFLYPGLAALVTDHTPETRRGVVVGIFSAVFLAGQTTGAFVFGYVT
ncbi:MAG: hypothetical protein AUG87_09550, partial [Candidatus Rokubacteria bacterium 13_1_20CM_4_70_14]